MWDAIISTFRRSLPLFLLGLSQISCVNILRDFADKSSDPYAIDRARNLMDRFEWDDAITTITPVLQTDPLNEEAIFIGASAYAGRALLRSLDLFVTLGTEITSKTMLVIFAEHFSQIEASQLDDLDTAIDLLERLGDTAAERPASLNLFAMLLYYSRIGAILNSNAFLATNEIRDNFTACKKSVSFAGVKTGITDEQIDTIMISFARIVDTAGSITGSGAGFDALRSLPGIGTLPMTPFPCATAAGADANTCLAIRALINVDDSGGIGLGTGDNLATYPESPGGVCLSTVP
jgi:hypothetical protein